MAKSNLHFEPEIVDIQHTVGIFDNTGKPEVITVGLPEKTALFALNEAAERLRSGADLTQGLSL